MINKTGDAPFFSIILPVYNVEEYIEECLISLVNQSFQQIEVICVIDGSPDHSREICECFAAKDNRFKVICQENQGAAAARNTGIKNARGEYLHFVDPDDRLPNSTVYECLYEALKDSRCDMLIGRSNYYIDTFEKLSEEGIFSTKRKENYNGLSFILENNYFFALTSGANKIIRRKMIEDHNLYWPLNVINEDDRWLPRVAAQSHSVIFTDLSIYDVRRRGGSLTSTKAKTHLARRGSGYMQTALQNCALIQATDCSKAATRNGLAYYIQLYFSGYKLCYESSGEKASALDILQYMKHAGNVKMRGLYWMSKLLRKKTVCKIMERRYGIR